MYNFDDILVLAASKISRKQAINLELRYAVTSLDEGT